MKICIDSDVVINLAAEHRDDVTPKSLYDDVNVTGAENVCNVCTKLEIKNIIFTSSVYIGKPDFDMNTLVTEVNCLLGRYGTLFHWPYWLGYLGGLCFDILAKLMRKKLPISSIRVKKFCSNTMFEARNIKKTNFKAPVSLVQGLENTIKYEFIDKVNEQVFYTE